MDNILDQMLLLKEDHRPIIEFIDHSLTTSLPTHRNQYNLQQPSLCLLQKGHIVPARRVMDSQRDPPPRTLGRCSCPPWTQSTRQGPWARAPSIPGARANHSFHPGARTGHCIRPEAGAYRQVPQESEQSTFGFALVLLWSVIPQVPSILQLHIIQLSSWFRHGLLGLQLHLNSPPLWLILCACSFRCHPGPRLHLGPASQWLHLGLTVLQCHPGPLSSHLHLGLHLSQLRLSVHRRHLDILPRLHPGSSSSSQASSSSSLPIASSVSTSKTPSLLCWTIFYGAKTHLPGRGV
ncbi:hypothetical protein DPX16_18729 [Anabarilius grahami]|uniref:Uncharacterized protein n=1 Tax=Anabarilius grahami TaxID=495550 RepID=A0A3N0Z252_ANAGA|nr:hypothetical protein DPX16_18729 [Anabarilius grahami]